MISIASSHPCDLPNANKYSIDDLSAADVAKRTIAAYELEQREVYPRTLDALRAALEGAGVLFIAENGGGAGVRLKK